MSDPRRSPAADVQTTFLKEPMGLLGITLFGAYFLLLSLLAIYVLIKIWPSSNETQLFGFTVPANLDLRLILVALVSGALGSFIHSATSFASYLGNRQLRRSWAWWYLLRPLIGMALAMIVYFIFRGGMLAPGVDGSGVSPYGVAGLAGLVGMFSRQASDKLKEVFDNLFTSKEDDKREDKMIPGKAGD